MRQILLAVLPMSHAPAGSPTYLRVASNIEVTVRISFLFTVSSVIVNPVTYDGTAPGTKLPGPLRLVYCISVTLPTPIAMPEISTTTLPGRLIAPVFVTTVTVGFENWARLKPNVQPLPKEMLLTVTGSF